MCVCLEYMRLQERLEYIMVKVILDHVMKKGYILRSFGGGIAIVRKHVVNITSSANERRFGEPSSQPALTTI